MFAGVTAEGINRELAYTLESAALCRQHGVRALAPIELGVLALLQGLGLEADNQLDMPFLPGVALPGEDTASQNRLTLLRGMLPSIRHVVEMNIDAESYLRSLPKKALAFADTPDMSCNMETSSVDPRANDFYCKLCWAELSNIYLHCNGCENLLNSDFNVCVSCFQKQRHTTFHQINKKIDAKLTFFNHVNTTMAKKCNGSCVSECLKCKGCPSCKCKCHSKFTVHYRTILVRDAVSLLDKLDNEVQSNRVSYHSETVTRLKLSFNRAATKALEEKRAFLQARCAAVPLSSAAPEGNSETAQVAFTESLKSPDVRLIDPSSVLYGSSEETSQGGRAVEPEAQMDSCLSTRACASAVLQVEVNDYRPKDSK